MTDQPTPEQLRAIIRAANADPDGTTYRRGNAVITRHARTTPDGWRAPGAASALGLPHRPAKGEA